MYSKRIKAIASLVNEGSIILDVGTDHGYLPIYLIKKEISKKAYAADISENALSSAKKNIEKMNLPIDTFLSDGLEKIKVKYDTLIITGMGYLTIKGILESGKLPDNIILQTNSEHYNMRKYMMKIGYKIEKEITLEDKKIFYVIIKYIKEKEKLSKKELLFGKSNSKEYFNYLLNKNYMIIKKVPFKKKLELYYQNIVLKNLLKKNRRCS